MAHTGGYRWSAVWRPCGITPHTVLQNKSVVCSGSQVTISTVMKLRWSVKRGGIIVKTYTKSTCSQLGTGLMRATNLICYLWNGQWYTVFVKNCKLNGNTSDGFWCICSKLQLSTDSVKALLPTGKYLLVIFGGCFSFLVHHFGKILDTRMRKLPLG